MRLYTVKVTALWGPVKLYSCVLLLLFSLSSAASAQTQSPQRDTQAVSALHQAINALGGQAAIASLQNSAAIGTITPASATSPVQAGKFKWEDDFSGKTYEFRYELQVGSATRVFVSGHGTPAFNNGTKLFPLPPHVSYAQPPFHLPAVMLSRELNDPNCSFSFVGVAPLNGVSAIHIRSQVNTGPIETVLSVHDWYFDAVRGLPLRVEYLTPSNSNMTDNKLAAADFSNYKTVNGVGVPFTITASEDGHVVSIATVVSISFNNGIAPADFDLTTGGAL